MTPPVVLLGPQRLRPTLLGAVERVAPDGPIAVITAGWEERESEIDALTAHLGRPIERLRLYERTEYVFVRDRAFFLEYRERRQRLRRAQTLYRRRLQHAMDALHETLAASGGDDIRLAAQEDAIDAVRRLDAWHEHRIAQDLARFESETSGPGHDELARHKEEIRRIVEGSSVLAIAGGNVAVLLNRMRLLGVADLLPTLPVVAWSAGAMVLGPRVVIYHDSPPQGQGYPEVFAPGFRLVEGILPLPHAHRRLRLDDERRVSVFARRFAPCRPLALADGAQVVIEAGRLAEFAGVRQLTTGGQLVPVLA